MPWVGALVGLAGSVIGGAMNKSAAGEQAQAQQEGINMARQGRERAIKRLDDRHIWGAANWLFPGLLSMPYGPSMFGNYKSPYGGGGGFLTPTPEGASEFGTRKKQKKAIKRGELPNPSVMGAPAADETQLPRQVPIPQGPQSFPITPAPTTTPPPSWGAGTNPPGMPWNSGPTPPTGPQLGPGTTAGSTFNGPPGPPVATTPGDLVMQHLLEYLKNPGQLSSIGYERAQENANQGLNTGTQMLLGRLSGMGIDPTRSGFGQALGQNVALNFGRERNEAARDYTLAQEQLRRADISTGIKAYQDFLQTVFGLQGARANAAQGGAYPTIQNPVDPSGGLGTSIGTSTGVLGNYLANYFANKQANQNNQYFTDDMTTGKPYAGPAKP